MRRLVRSRLRLVFAVAIAAALAGLAGPAAALTAPQAAPAAALPAAVADSASRTIPRSPTTGVDDFSFATMHADYTLGRDAEGHSTLATTETLVAWFPETDQNHGIRRYLPTHYQGQPTGLAIRGVTDAGGTDRDYEVETITDDSGADYLEVTIADDAFVHGEQTYVISYDQSNVILFPDDSTDQEFYWEVNGTGWAQPFGTVSATVHLAPELVPHLTGNTACYQGGAASGATCDSLISREDGDGWAVEATARDLAAREGLTLAVGFTEGTFVPRDDSFTANPFPSIALLAALVALVSALVAVVVRATRWQNQPGRPTIIAEYLPPAGVNLLQAGNVLGARAGGKAMTAQFLQFAVTGAVRVLEGDGKNHFLLELRSRAGLDPTERAVLAALFPEGQKIGTVRDLKKKSTSLGTALQKVRSGVRKQMLADGLREKKGGALRPWLIAVGTATGMLAVVASIIAFATEVAGAWPALFLVVGLVGAIVTLAVIGDVRPLTARGAELRDYLKGVTVYISLAEADRLRVLQSPLGALRTHYRPDTASGRGAIATEPVQVLKLYERLLPFAVLTGQEKEWSRVLGDYYAGTREQPDWYIGTAPFSAAYFATGVAAFTSSAAAGVAASSSSSGSGGGGSVGGGGGGGGGGGV